MAESVQIENTINESENTEFRSGKLIDTLQPKSEPIDYDYSEIMPSFESQALDTEPKLEPYEQLTIIHHEIECIDNRYPDHDSDSSTANQGTSSTNGSSNVVVDCPYELVPGADGAPLRHKCPLCEKTFRIASYVKRHIDSVHNPETRIHTCDKCSRSFGRKQNLERHEAVHESVKDYKCRKCNRDFKWRANFVRHERICLQNEISTSQSYTCACGRSFCSETYLERHQASPCKPRIRFNGNGKFQCGICSLRMCSRYSIKRHYALLHPGIRSPFGPFVTKEGQPHMNKMNVAYLNDYTCGICDRKFKNRSKMDTHVFDEHGGLLFGVNIADVFACDVCNMTTRTKYNIQRHYAIVHPAVKCPFLPERGSGVASDALCERGSLASFQSKQSIASCNDFSCSLCKRRFVSKTRLAEHMISEHADDGVGICDSSAETHAAGNEIRAEVDKASMLLERPIQCKDCGSEFRNQSRLKEHEDKCIRRQQTQPQTELRVCPHCELKFTSKDPALTLSRHLKNHVCRTCGVCLLVFDTRFQLHQHRRTEHKFLVTTTTSEEESLKATPDNVLTEASRKYKCDLCSLKVNSLRNLRHHFILRHPEEMHDVASQAACGFCDREFSDHNTLEKHRIADHSDFTSTDGAEVNKGTSQAHMDRSKSEIAVFPCDECGEVFTRRNQLRFHLTTCTTNLDCMSCRFCRKQFRNNSALKKHSQICRTCKICKTRFKTSRGYQKHIRTHHGFETRCGLRNITAKIRTLTYRCQQCSRIFRDRRTLAAHRVVHNEPRFECSTCHGRFFTDKALNDHTKQHELLVEEVPEQAQIQRKLRQRKRGNPTIANVSSVRAVVLNASAPGEIVQTSTPVTQYFTCSVCKLFFTSELYLKNHHNAEHLAFHQCTHCPLKFKNRHALSTHHRKHSTQPPIATRLPMAENTDEFKCFMCRDCFATKESFSQHYKEVHVGVSCDICHRKFNNFRARNAHKRVHQKDEK